MRFSTATLAFTVGLVLAWTELLQAARGIPAPLLVQLCDNWTIIAAEVVETRPKPDNEFDGFGPYNTTFRVVRVVAASKRMEPQFVPGAQITLDLSCGYAATVEDYGGIDAQSGIPDALKSGEKFYLSVKPSGVARYEHARGAGAAKWVRQFDPAYEALVSKVNNLALLPEDDRYRRCVETVADSAAPDSLRLAAISGIYYWGRTHPTPEAERAARARAYADLLRIWNDPSARLSGDLLSALDYRLKTLAHDEPEWLEARQRVWLGWFLSPLPADEAEREDALNKRWNNSGLFREMFNDRPEVFADRLMRIVERQDLAMRLRAACFSVIAHGFETSESENQAWEAFLQKTLPELIRDSDVITLRLLSYFGSRAVEPIDQYTRRRFIPNEHVARAMERARSRLQQRPELPQADTAAMELSKAIEAIRRAHRTEGQRR